MISLSKINVGNDCTIKKIETEDNELRNFLFTLGCFENQVITLVSKISNNYVVKIKSAKYNINEDVAHIIIVEEVTK